MNDLSKRINDLESKHIPYNIEVLEGEYEEYYVLSVYDTYNDQIIEYYDINKNLVEINHSKENDFT